MGYEIDFSGKFKKDVKRCQKRGYNMPSLDKAMLLLRTSGKLPAKYSTHRLSGDYNGFLECHIKPDWLLIWKQDDIKKEIYLDRTGTHSDLF